MNGYVLVFWIMLPTLVAASLRWGGPPERIASLLYGAAAVASVIPATRPHLSWTGLEVWILLVDAALLGGLCYLVVRYWRWWIILAAAMQTISTTAHLARLMDPAFDRTAYALMEGISSYPTLIVLAIAIWRSSRRSSVALERGSRSSPRGG